MLCWGPSRWGVRRLLAHVKHLPRDSAYVRELQGPGAYWDEQVELLAQIVDAVRVNSYYLLRVNGGDPDEPQPTRRPMVGPVVSVGLADFDALIGE